MQWQQFINKMGSEMLERISLILMDDVMLDFLLLDESGTLMTIFKGWR